MHSILKQNLETYLEGRLPSAVERDLENHLAGCAECRQAVEDARQTSRWLRALVAADAPEPSVGFYLKVRESIETGGGFSFWGMLFPAVRQLAFACFMLLVLLGSYYLGIRSTGLGDTTAELLLDMPVEREVPAMLAAQPGDPKAWCVQCWRARRDRAMHADQHANLERAMLALVASPVGD